MEENKKTVVIIKSQKIVWPIVILVIGLLIVISSVVSNPPAVDAGWVIVLGSLSYISLKKRAFGKNKFSVLRRIGEFIAVAYILLISLVAFSNGWIVEHPLYYFIIPLLAILANVIIFFKKLPPQKS